MANPNLHLCLHLPKPVGGVKKWGCPAGQVSKYDAEIICMNNQHFLPSRIADILCQEHDLDPAVINQKSVERRLHTIKTKGLATLSPLNEDSDITAVDAPKKCK
jgi:hypothetical protein